MPDLKGKLSEEEKQKIRSWIDARRATALLICPVCNKTDWVVADHLVQPLTLGEKFAAMLGGTAYPVAQVVSLQCGYTMYFNAVLMGIVKRTADTNTESQGEASNEDSKVGEGTNA
jgi:hypothetical protein